MEGESDGGHRNSRRGERVLVDAHSRGDIGGLVGEREEVSVTENVLCRGSSRGSYRGCGASVRQTADAHSREQRGITEQGK